MKKIIAANWKMNGDLHLAEAILPHLSKTTHQIIILPPAILISDIQKLICETNIQLGGQNCYIGESGAYTGEISAKMFAKAGCSYVLVGHSERRHVFNESNEQISKKFIAVCEQNIVPILCIGETEQQYLRGETVQILQQQLEFLSKLSLKQFVIAYEPVWAIGTGRVPDMRTIAKVHGWIKQFLLKECLRDGLTMSIIYGGSVNSKNAESITSLPDVDGVLVGGASLNPQEFLEIIKCIK